MLIQGISLSILIDTYIDLCVEQNVPECLNFAQYGIN